MVVAYGAEARIGNKYGQFVEEAKKHARFASPLIAVQFGLMVCHHGVYIRLQTPSAANDVTYI